MESDLDAAAVRVNLNSKVVGSERWLKGFVELKGTADLGFNSAVCNITSNHLSHCSFQDIEKCNFVIDPGHGSSAIICINICIRITYS